MSLVAVPPTVRVTTSEEAVDPVRVRVKVEAADPSDVVSEGVREMETVGVGGTSSMVRVEEKGDPRSYPA